MNTLLQSDPPRNNTGRRVEKYKRQGLSALLLQIVVLLAFLASSCVFATPRHGKHEAEFMEITKWMEQNGFSPIDSEPSAKAWPAYQHYDYQWYDGSYQGSPNFQIFTFFDEKGLLHAFPSKQGGPDNRKSVPAQLEVKQRFYVAFNQWTQDSLHIVNKLYKDYAWEALGIKPGQDVTDNSWYPLVDAPGTSIFGKYFDDELSSLLEKDRMHKHNWMPGVEAKLNFNPIFASRFPAAYDMKITLLASGNVHVSFIYPRDGTKTEIEYKVVYGEKGWRISDIIYTSLGGTTLREILQK